MSENENKIKLPTTKITPARGRIYCKAYPIDVSKAEKQTKSGIILLPGTRINEKTGEKLKHYVYLVVRVGPMDGYIKIQEEEDGEYRDIRRGDEVFWHMPVDAQSLNWAMVIDWETGEELVMFHETELSGAQPFLTTDML